MKYRAIATVLVSLGVSCMQAWSDGLPPVKPPSPVTVSGTVWELDDALFHGCFHNAFEGTPVQLEDGGWKAGAQTIQRTKGVLTGIGTNHAAMELRFRLEAAPAGDSTLVLTGLNDRLAAIHPVRLALNGRELAAGVTFPRNRAPELKLNQRYFVGWEERRVAVPAGVLKAGENRLEIANTANAFTAETWPFVLIDKVRWEFAAPVSATIEPPPPPLFYYGLTEGVETMLWPVVATDNRVTLLTGVPLEYNVFATMPHELPLGTMGPLKGEPTRPKREILAHLWSKSPIRVTTLDGTPVEPVALADGQLFTAPIDRLIAYETPHPSQGVRLFLQASEPFEDGELRAWYSVDGVDYRPSSYPLRGTDLEPVEGREQLDFQLSLWGGGVPSEPAAMQTYIDMLRGAGFNHAFTGASPELNQALKAAGFGVHPRYGWFGGKFKVTDANRQWAAVSSSGKPSTRDFCPLAILDHADDPELGKYFAEARKLAALDNIDGLCVDFECAPVWCWCDRCLALFTKETGLTVKDRSEVAPGGALYDAYRDFGRRRNRDLLARVKQEMQAVNPELDYLALASAADLPAYWYDPRGARHSIRELARFADGIYASHYCYEVPGGMKAVLPTIDTVRRFGVQSGRSVETCLIAPVAQTVSEFPRYRGAAMRPEMTRLMVLLTALGGGKGIAFFRGDCFDGAQYAAVRQAVSELLALRPYLAAGLDHSGEVSVSIEGGAPLRFETEMAQNLLSRFIWRPEPQYFHDHVQLLRDTTGRDRLVALFNYADSPQTLRVRFTGLFDDRYAASDALSGEALPETTRRQLEGDGMTIEVKPRDCRLIRLTTIEE